MRIRPTMLLLLVSPFVLPVFVAYIQWATVGLPAALPAPAPLVDDSLAQGFPAWLRVTHYVNFLFIIMLVRSGLQILMDHPGLYWNVRCTPRTEWLRLTPIEVPTDQVWTAKEDCVCQSFRVDPTSPVSLWHRVKLEDGISLCRLRHNFRNLEE